MVKLWDELNTKGNQAMITRQQIKNDYDCNADGIIRSPGKFQGEYIWSPYWYEASLNEAPDYWNHWGHSKTLVEVSAEDREVWPEIEADTIAFLVTEREQGFVSVSEVSAREYEKVCEELEQAQSEEDEGNG